MLETVGKYYKRQEKGEVLRNVGRCRKICGSDRKTLQVAEHVRSLAKYNKCKDKINSRRYMEKWLGDRANVSKT